MPVSSNLSNLALRFGQSAARGTMLLPVSTYGRYRVRAGGTPTMTSATSRILFKQVLVYRGYGWWRTVVEPNPLTTLTMMRVESDPERPVGTSVGLMEAAKCVS